MLDESKTGQTENTPSCVASDAEMIGVNSVDYCLHTHGLCSLNTPGKMFSLNTLVSREQDKPKNRPSWVDNTPSLVVKCSEQSP